MLRKPPAEEDLNKAYCQLVWTETRFWILWQFLREKEPYSSILTFPPSFSCG
jgi:hypothetical protein